MSNWREQFEDESVFDASTALFVQYYHYAVLVLLVTFAFWNRTKNWQNYVVNGEVLFRGNDPWYHYRSTQYIVNNFPASMPFDTWTHFSFGTASAQFGTIYDQFVALAALVVGLGSPDAELVRMVALFAPAAIAALIAVPTYVIGRRIGGRFAGVVGVAILAFASDRLLSLSVAGFYDHHVAEALTQALAVLGVMVALHVAEQEKPVCELLAAREVDALRRPLGWAVLAGFAVSLYLAVWPPGVLLVGILGVFFVVHLSFEYLRGRSPEHAAFAGAVALGTTGVLQLSSVRATEIGATSRGLLQPGLAFAVAFGCVFMAWLARQWDTRNLVPYGYPLAVVGIISAGAAVMAVALPGLFGFFSDQILRVVGLELASPTAGTVGEAQPLQPGRLYSFYRLALFTALTGGLILLARQYFDEEPRGEHLLVVVWFVFIVAATLTQARFAYYLTVPVAALNAAFVGAVMKLVGGVDESLEIEAYQILAVAAVLMVVIAPLFLFGAGPIRSASAAQNPGGVVGWQDSLDWMADNTPEEGQYANASAEPMEYYGTYKRTGDYDYPAGAYGVMSWWDYGHWITASGERIPNANPFQQGSDDAARYLLSQSENESFAVLDEIDEDDAHTRYVMVDWKMVQTESLRPVRGKFFAPPTFVDGVDRSTYYTRVLATDQLRQRGLFSSTLAIRHKQAYYNSTMARLYLYHGSAQEPRPYVLDWQRQERNLGNGETFVGAPQQGPPVKLFDNMSAARAFAEDDDTAQIGGFGPYPRERVPALEHYRLVYMDERSALEGGGEVAAFRRNLQQSGLDRQLQEQSGEDAGSQIQQQAVQTLYPNSPAWTKAFERVDGATVEGTGPANASLQLQVQLQPENGVPFTYTQRVETDASGEFSTTVPYATTGYDEVGPADGYTNTSVRATGPYAITSSIRLNESGAIVRYTGTVNVTERQVVGADGSPAVVEIEEQVLSRPSGNESSSGNGNSTGSTDGGDGGSSGGGQSVTGPGTVRVGAATADP